ncbi:MAG: YggT family protein [Deltaproteobacteria bacterium]|nr:YggT family protein [Deltaproteobacteria bacterium]
MFALANLIRAFALVLDYALTAYMWMTIIRALLSWVNPDPYNPIVRFLYQVTEPVLYRIRRIVPYMGGLDLSPLIVILVIYFLKWFLVATLIDIAFRMRLGVST